MGNKSSKKAKNTETTAQQTSDAPVPPEEGSPEPCPTEVKIWTIIFIDKDGNPLSNKAWELGTVTGTAEAGKIELKETDLDTNNILKITLGEAPPEPEPTADPEFDPLKYPPDIITKNFKDVAPEPASPKNLEVEFEVKKDELPAFDALQGIQIRLYNLGFGCDDGSDDIYTTRSVKAFQRMYLDQDDPSGVVTDIQDRLQTEHDKA